MHVDALNVLTIDVATQVRSLVYHQALLALLVGKMGECGSEETRANYQIVIIVHILKILFMYGILINAKLIRQDREYTITNSIIIEYH